MKTARPVWSPAAEWENNVKCASPSEYLKNGTDWDCYTWKTTGTVEMHRPGARGPSLQLLRPSVSGERDLLAETGNQIILVTSVFHLNCINCCFLYFTMGPLYLNTYIWKGASLRTPPCFKLLNTFSFYDIWQLPQILLHVQNERMRWWVFSCNMQLPH